MTDRDRAPAAPTDRTAPTPPGDRSSAETSAAPEPRTDLTNIVIKDRLAALIANLDGHLPQPQRLDRRVGQQLLADPLLERIELRPRRRPLIPRRRRRRHARRPCHDAPPAAALISPLRDAARRSTSRLISAHCSTPTTPSSSPIHTDQTRVTGRPDNTDPTPSGPLFNRRRWPSIQPAPTLAASQIAPRKLACSNRSPRALRPRGNSSQRRSRRDVRRSGRMVRCLRKPRLCRRFAAGGRSTGLGGLQAERSRSITFSLPGRAPIGSTSGSPSGCEPLMSQGG